ncbi:MAG TPA: hypothetical protein VII30_11520 [Gemmatimonadaceae bacterium]
MTAPIYLYAIVAAAGVCGVVAAWANFNLNKRNNQFANAFGFYRRYLELCVEHSDLAEPQEKLSEGDAKYRQYEWFIGVLFRASEEVLQHCDKKEKKKWNTTVRNQLSYHARYLRESPWLKTTGMDLYSKDLRKLIKEFQAE